MGRTFVSIRKPVRRRDRNPQVPAAGWRAKGLEMETTGLHCDGKFVLLGATVK